MKFGIMKAYTLKDHNIATLNKGMKISLMEL